MTEITEQIGSAQVINLRSARETSPNTTPQAVSDTISKAPEAATVAFPSLAASRSDNEVNSKDPLERAAAAIEELILNEGQEPTTKLRINMNDEDGSFVYQSVDTETGEVLDQFPPETIMEMLNNIRALEGLAVDDTI